MSTPIRRIHDGVARQHVATSPALHVHDGPGRDCTHTVDVERVCCLVRGAALHSALGAGFRLKVGPDVLRVIVALGRQRISPLILVVWRLGQDQVVDVDHDAELVQHHFLRPGERHYDPSQKSGRTIVPTTMPPLACSRSLWARAISSALDALAADTPPRLYCWTRWGSPAMISSASAAASRGLSLCSESRNCSSSSVKTGESPLSGIRSRTC